MDLKLEAWLAGLQLFREVGGGREHSHIRKTLREWGSEFGTYDPEIRFRIPIPTGDPPPGIFDQKNPSPQRLARRFVCATQGAFLQDVL